MLVIVYSGTVRIIFNRWNIDYWLNGMRNEKENIFGNDSWFEFSQKSEVMWTLPEQKKEAELGKDGRSVEFWETIASTDSILMSHDILVSCPFFMLNLCDAWEEKIFIIESIPCCHN